MISRYTLPAMHELWVRPETKLEYWLKVELAWLRARAEIGNLSKDVHETITQYSKVNVERMRVIEKDTKHDLIAFVQDVQQSLVEAGVGEHKEEFHKFLTSYDTEDPALILMMRESVSLIIKEMEELYVTLRKKAKEYKFALLIADTHGQDAEPSTFGALLLVYAEAVKRSIRRLSHVFLEELSEGKMSGAVGTYAGMNPRLEELALSYLDLKPAFAETQILQRDRHAMVISVVTIAGATIEQMALTFWSRMHSRVRELEEPRSENQKGSSAMAHKKNPIVDEQERGLARLLRGDLSAMIEDIATIGWREISQSSVERVAMVDAFILLHYMTVKMRGIVDKMTVFTERMKKNLDEATYGVWAGQQVRNALMNAGVDYETAYRYVQRCSFEAVKTEQHVMWFFCREVLSDTDRRTARDVLDEGNLTECFDAMKYLELGINYIFSRQTPLSEIGEQS